MRQRIMRSGISRIEEVYDISMTDRITVDPNIHFGKSCITGTRITVQNVLELLEEGITFDEIIRDYYSDLAVEDIQACLRYAIALVKPKTFI